MALLARRERGAEDSLTAIVLVAALVIGVILASDVFGSGAGVDQLLFGSLLLTGPDDLALAAGASVGALLATLALGPRWLAHGFDPAAARALGLRSGLPDAVLLALVALVAVAALRIAGALLATALVVVPAATTRLVIDRLVPWQLAALALGGCGVSSGSSSDGRLRVVATTTQLADFARAVGGPRIDLTQLLRANTDPHEYEPRPHDVLAVARADVVLRSGGDVDGWLADVVEQAGGSPTGGDARARRPYAKAEPHWWHDPRNAAYAVRRIRAALTRADPAGRAAFARGAAAELARLRALDQAIARCMAAVPVAKRTLVTDHDAFGAFAARYGVRVVGAVIPARTTQAQPSAGELSRLAAVIRRARVRAVFPEASLSPRLAPALAPPTRAHARYTPFGGAARPAGP